jgi:hypothetical protein
LISSFVGEWEGITRFLYSTLCGFPVSRALISSFVEERGRASDLVGLAAVRAAPGAESASAAARERLRFENIVTLLVRAGTVRRRWVLPDLARLDDRSS